MGLINNIDYIVAFHDDHRYDEIYQKRPDLIKEFSGAILYNTENKSWIDLYGDNGRIYSPSEQLKTAIRRLMA